MLGAQEIRELRLDNGLRVLLLRRDTAPTADVRLVVPTGAVPHGDLVALKVLAACLLDCRRAHDSRRPAAALVETGALASVAVNQTVLTTTVSVLASGLPAALRMLGPAVLDPGYHTGDAWATANRLAASVAKSWDRRAMREHLLLARRFGDHPVTARPVSATDLTAVDGARLTSVHRDYLVPAGAVLVVVGQFDADTETVVSDTLGTWRGKALSRPLPPLAPVSPPDVMSLSDGQGDGNGCSVLLAGQGVGLDHPDHPAVQVASALVGGYPSACLPRRLRDELGLAYTVGASPRPSPVGSWHSIEFSCAATDAQTAFSATAEVLTRLSLGDVTDGEIEVARRYAAAAPRIATANQAGVANAIASFAVASLPRELLTGFPDRVRALDAADVRHALARYFQPERMHGLAESLAGLPHSGRLGCWPVGAG